MCSYIKKFRADVYQPAHPIAMWRVGRQRRTLATRCTSTMLHTSVSQPPALGKGFVVTSEPGTRYFTNPWHGLGSEPLLSLEDQNIFSGTGASET